MPTSVQSAGTPGRRLGAPKRGVRRIEKRTQGKGPTKASKKRPEWDVSLGVSLPFYLFMLVFVLNDTLSGAVKT